MIGIDQEERLLEKAKDLLNGVAENLDGQTGQRLERIRTNVLRAAEEKASGFFTPLRWILVGGFGTATMAAVALFFWLNPSPRDFPAKHVEDFEIIISREPIDFYQDLEFYRWMATPNGPTDRAV
ncbi:MAG: hypothetical protein ABSF48_21000 [Thermodesulfobacteriota bacterium]|jgi:hypothetical protein